MLAPQMDLGLQKDCETVAIGPLEILRLDRSAAVDLVEDSVLGKQKTAIAICNAHTILTAFDDPRFAETLQHMTLLNDGAGANLASLILHGHAFPDNLNGTDLIPYVLSSIRTPMRVFLLGAREEVLQRTRQVIEQDYPQHQVVGCRNGYFQPEDNEAVCAQISSVNPDLLLVAMGNPAQERFIVENRDRIDATVCIGVGALFDFMSGSVVRAPKVVQALGLEWLFRLLQEPTRLWKRYVVGIPRFLLAINRLRSRT
ncbi:MAG: WecB/TagA/CpsF family glycosyltransferase [Parasphingorhabdus sp.]|uniref:WecB/TagA/CpsF family glycosyltransferase n=1 Tax=Alphaproteobacteria TaxID=28211 RepID=UPI0032635710